MEINHVAAIVTGGASGLDEAAGAATAAAIDGLYVKVNVADDDSVSGGLDLAEAAHGVARILVNCVGVAPASDESLACVRPAAANVDKALTRTKISYRRFSNLGGCFRTCRSIADFEVYGQSKPKSAFDNCPRS